MNSKDRKIQIASFNDTTVVGINTVLVDYKLAWNLNNVLSLDLVRYDDLIFEGTPFSFFYYNAGENYNVYNLVSLVNEFRTLYPFKPRLDYLFLVQGGISEEWQGDIISGLRSIEGVQHAFILDKDKKLRQLLEIIAGCEQQMTDRKKKCTDIKEVRKQMRQKEAEQKALWESAQL